MDPSFRLMIRAVNEFGELEEQRIVSGFKDLEEAKVFGRRVWDEVSGYRKSISVSQYWKTIFNYDEEKALQSRRRKRS